MNWQDFLSFRRMITPLIIQVLFWVGIAISTLLGLIVLVSGIIGGIGDDSIGAVLGGLCLGPAIIVLGILTSRIYAELLILAFRVNETLTDIKDLLQRQE